MRTLTSMHKETIMLKKTLVALATLGVVGIVAKLILDFVTDES